MGSSDREDSVLARLPDGSQVLSTLLPDGVPPGHVYRVVNSGGTVLREFSTLIELNTFLSLYTSGIQADRAD